LPNIFLNHEDREDRKEKEQSKVHCPMGVLPKGLIRHQKCLCEFILLLDFCEAISCDRVQGFNYKLFAEIASPGKGMEKNSQ
jgi:hypothetical protein